MLSNWALAIAGPVVWFTNTFRAAGATSESQEITLTPAFSARFRAGATALGSLPAIARDCTFWPVALLMKGICAAAVPCDGPTCLNFPFSSPAACFAPLAAASK